MKNKLKYIDENNGCLYPIELCNDIPFNVKRIFYVTDIPAGEIRGQHSHYLTKQILICLQGHITCILFDGITETKTELYSGESVLVPNLIWDSQIYHTDNDILMSLCSTNYDPSDYINDRDEYIKYIKSLKDK